MRVKKLLAGGLTAAMLGGASLLAAAPTSADVITPMERSSDGDADGFMLILTPPGKALAPPTNLRVRVIEHHLESSDPFGGYGVTILREGILTWTGVPGIDKYNIYKDGSYLTTVRGTTYFMPGNPDTSARWTVVSVDDDTNRFSPQSKPAVWRGASLFS